MRRFAADFSAFRSASLLLFSLDFGPIERAQHNDRWDDAAAILTDAARRPSCGRRRMHCMEVVGRWLMGRLRM